MTDPTVTPHAHHPTVHIPGAGETVALAWRAVGAVILAVILAGYAVGAAGCSRPVTREPVPPATTDAVTAPNAVNRACYQFFRYTRTDLSRTAVEGDVNYVASLQGVPSNITEAVRRYYTSPGGTEADRNRVKKVCIDAGWLPGTKATDQPPAQ